MTKVYKLPRLTETFAMKEGIHPVITNRAAKLSQDIERFILQYESMQKHNDELQITNEDLQLIKKLMVAKETLDNLTQSSK